MDTFEVVRFGLGILLFISLVVNLFYHVIKAFTKMRNKNYAKETVHTFRCRNCEEVYQLNGEEARDRIRSWSNKAEKRTPKGQTTAIRFVCPQCNEKEFQYRVFEGNGISILGNVLARFDQASKEIVKDLLVKGFLPIFILLPVLVMIFK